MRPLTLVLASGSPRRADLLARLGLTFTVRVPDVDEEVRAGETAGTHVRRIAARKAAAAAGPGELVVAADTAVTIDGAVLGKPIDADEARRTLLRLSGRTHEVLTAVAVVRTDEEPTRRALEVETTLVTFAPIDEATLDWYVSTGEPLDKAGAYGIQGAGGLFVERIAGNPSNVVGLPLALLHRLVGAVGADLLGFRHTPPGTPGTLGP